MKNTIREYWRIVIAIIFFSIVGIACPPLSGAASKSGAERLIIGHLRDHPECEAREMLPDLASVEIVQEFHINPNVAGWIREGRIFINTNKKCKWTDRKIALFLIHELVHIRGHCLNDSIRSYDKAKPICTFLGRRIYHSMDLTEVIKDHFKEGKHGSND